VVVHYHLLKNAGTSLDDALKTVFGSRWRNVEAKKGHHLPPDELASFIRRTPAAQVVSSHNAALPVPEIEGVSVLPVLFLRHPIDRVPSIYRFERKQFPVRTRGAMMAKVMSFPRYVRWRLGYDELIANFQVERLSRGSARPGTLEGALEALERLPFVGVVERYEESLRILEGHLGGAFPRTRLEVVHSNVSKGRASSLERRLRTARESLGAALYEELLERNREDLELHRVATEALGG